MLRTFLKQLSSNSKHRTLQESHVPWVISRALAAFGPLVLAEANEWTEWFFTVDGGGVGGVGQKWCPEDWTKEGVLIIIINSSHIL